MTKLLLLALTLNAIALSVFATPTCNIYLKGNTATAAYWQCLANENGLTPQQERAITDNSAKVGITAIQASQIQSNQNFTFMNLKSVITLATVRTVTFIISDSLSAADKTQAVDGTISANTQYLFTCIPNGVTDQITTSSGNPIMNVSFVTSPFSFTWTTDSSSELNLMTNSGTLTCSAKLTRYG